MKQLVLVFAEPRPLQLPTQGKWSLVCNRI